jgi:hypothetical protein
MAEIHVKRLPAGYVILVEDPVLSNNRMFISTVGHDTTTLAPLFQKNWSFNFADNFNLSYGDQNWGEMFLEKGFVTCWSNSDSSLFDTQWMGYYQVTLDWNFFPVKPGWKTINGRVLMARRYSLPGSTTEIGTGQGEQYLYPSLDITSGSGASMTNTGYYPNYYIYEDVSNQRIWGMEQGAANGSYIIRQDTYETTLGTGSRITPPNNGSSQQFFLGVDDLGFLTFVGVQDGTASTFYSQYTFFRNIIWRSRIGSS